MSKYLQWCLFFLICLNAWALPVSDSLKIKWRCPQEYLGNNVPQLPEEADLELSYDGDGKINIHPNIFAIKFLSKNYLKKLKQQLVKNKTTIDYSSCLLDFEKDSLAAMSEYQQKNCAEKNLDRPICKSTDQDMASFFKNEILEGPFFKEHSLDFGRTLKVLSRSEAFDIVKKYCDGSLSDRSQLFTPSILEIFKNYRKEYTSEIGLNCTKQYLSDFTLKRSELEAERCQDINSRECKDFLKHLKKFSIELEVLVADKKRAVEDAGKSLYNKNRYLPHAAKVDEILGQNPERICGEYSAGWIKDGETWMNALDYDGAIANNIENLKSLDGNCQNMLLQNYIASKLKVLEDTSMSDFCKNHETEDCINHRRDRKSIMDNIIQLMGGSYGARSESILKTAQCRVDDSKPMIDNMVDALKNIKQAINCAPVEPGQFKVVDTRSDSDASTGDYLLKRREDGNYQAILNYEFDHNDPSIAKEMFERVQACFASISPYLKGPNGQQLELIAMDKEDISSLPKNQRPRVNKVGIAGPNIRSHSRLYEGNIDCPTIAHETMHHLGLCDEYKEMWHGEGKNYDCRVVPKVESLMKNHNTAFRKAIPRTISCECNSLTCTTIMNSKNDALIKLYLSATIYSDTDWQFRSRFCSEKKLPALEYGKLLLSPDRAVALVSDSSTDIVVESRQLYENGKKVDRSSISCQCEANNSECIDGIKKLKELSQSMRELSYCPSGTSNKSERQGIVSGNDKSHFDGKMLTIVTRPEWPSLIHPSHFTRIIGGACSKIGKEYLICEKFAYQNGTPETCKVPKECSDDNYFLGVTK